MAVSIFDLTKEKKDETISIFDFKKEPLEVTEPNAFALLNDPNDIDVRIKEVLDLAEETDLPITTVEKIYDPLAEMIKNLPGPEFRTTPKDIREPYEAPEEEPMRIGPAELKKTRLERFFGFSYPPKPPDWEYASPIEKFIFATMPISDFLGRIGGKIASDWRIVKKEDVRKTLAGELAEDLEWYQKSPEVIGWTAEKAAEYIALKAIFKLSGLHRVLGTVGQKLSRPFMSKEIIARGGLEKVSTMSVTGLRNMGRQALQNFLAAAPENATFIASWSGFDSYMKGNSPQQIAIDTAEGAGWGIAITAGFAAIGQIAGAPEIKLAFRRAIYNLNKKYPKVMDLVGKKVRQEIIDDWVKIYSQQTGRDIRFIDLTKTQQARFRNAVRLAEKELIRAAKHEQAIRAYWAAETQRAAEAAKAKPPTKPTPEAIEKVIEPVKAELEKIGIEVAKVAPEIAKITPEPPPKPIIPERPPTVPKERAGPLYEEDKALAEATKAGEQIRKAQTTTEIVEQARQFGETIKDGTVLEDATGETHYVVRGNFIELYDAETGRFLTVYYLRTGLKKGQAKQEVPLSNDALDIFARSKIVGSNARTEESKLISYDEPTPAKPIKPEIPQLAKIRAQMTMAEIAKEYEAKYEIIKKKSEEQGLLALSDDEFEAFIAKENFVPEEYTREAGFIAVPDFGVISDMYNRAHDWMITFGEAKRIHPELYDKLMKSYGQRGASVEKAIDEVGRIIEEPLSLEEDSSLALIYEDKRLEPPEELKDVYDKFSTLLDRLEKIQLKEKIFQRPFQERMIEENQVKIEQLTTELKHPTQSKRIQALVAENEELKNMRYLSHSIVARRTIEAKVNRLKGDERKAFISRMSSIYRKRKGKLFLRDYLDIGLITKEDIRMTRLATQELADYYVRSSYKTLYDYGKAEGLIKPTTPELRAEGWLNQKELGIIAPELKEQLIHPLYGSALAELKSMRLRTGGFGQQILSMTKIGQFIKPSIIWTYNAVQKYMRGMYSFNPIKESKLLTQATREVLSKSPLYHKLNADNLYQFPYEVSKGSREKQINLFIRQNSKEINRLMKILEKTTDMSWAPEDMNLGKLSKNMMIAAHKAVAQVTWTGDKIQRTQSYLILRDMGYPHDEAIKVASKSHGAYSVLSERYKKIASKLLFVYSFRFLMPIEIGKILTEPVTESVQAFLKKEKIPPYKAKRWAKAWIGAIAIPVMIDQYMKYRGFKKEGAHLGPLAWKWKKEITVEGKKSEVVVGMNYILNMPVKYAQRLMYYNPIRPETRTQQVLENITKWEIHPLYRIFFWDINENRRSFGSGIEVYDTEAGLPTQLGQIAKYVFGQSFRFWGGMMDAIGEGEMTEKERMEQEKIFDSALTDLDKFLFTVLGYKYTRQNLKNRQVIMAKYLNKELASRRFSIEKKYEGEEKKRRIDSLKRWAEKCQHWILNDMK